MYNSKWDFFLSSSWMPCWDTDTSIFALPIPCEVRQCICVPVYIQLQRYAIQWRGNSARTVFDEHGLSRKHGYSRWMHIPQNAVSTNQCLRYLFDFSLTFWYNLTESGAVFTLGKSYLSENHQSYFFIRNDPIRKLIAGSNQSAVICGKPKLI